MTAVVTVGHVPHRWSVTVDGVRVATCTVDCELRRRGVRNPDAVPLALALEASSAVRAGVAAHAARHGATAEPVAVGGEWRGEARRDGRLLTEARSATERGVRQRLSRALRQLEVQP